MVNNILDNIAPTIREFAVRCIADLQKELKRIRAVLAGLEAPQRRSDSSSARLPAEPS